MEIYNLNIYFHFKSHLDHNIQFSCVWKLIFTVPVHKTDKYLVIWRRLLGKCMDIFVEVLFYNNVPFLSLYM